MRPVQSLTLLVWQVLVHRDVAVGPRPRAGLRPDRRPPRSPLTAEQVADLARVGDSAARATVERYVNRLARALAHVINIMDPDVVVLGGGVSKTEGLPEKVAPQLRTYVFGGEVRTPVVCARYGDSSGVRGAAWLWNLP